MELIPKPTAMVMAMVATMVLKVLKVLMVIMDTMDMDIIERQVLTEKLSIHNTKIMCQNGEETQLTMLIIEHMEIQSLRMSDQATTEDITNQILLKRTGTRV
jgi:hypothetical protein